MRGEVRAHEDGDAVVLSIPVRQGPLSPRDDLTKGTSRSVVVVVLANVSRNSFVVFFGLRPCRYPIAPCPQSHHWSKQPEPWPPEFQLSHNKAVPLADQNAVHHQRMILERVKKVGDIARPARSFLDVDDVEDDLAWTRLDPR